MEGNTRWPSSRVTKYVGEHPEVSIEPPVEGVWRATVSLDCGYGYMHGRTEDELLAKLADVLGA